MRCSARSNEVRRFQRPQTNDFSRVATVKNKVTKKQGKGRATKAKQRRWRESPPVVGIPAASGSFTKKSPSRRSAGELREEVPGRYQSAIQSGDLRGITVKCEFLFE
jgi:hypothetical protein